MANPAPESGQAGPLVAQAVERMAAAKIAVGLRPLAVLGLFGLVQFLRNGLQADEHLVLMIGAVLSMVAMVGYGLQAVSTVLEKTSRWDSVVFAGSFVPLVFAGFVIVTSIRDLTRVGAESGLGPVVANLFLLVLALMCLRAQWKLIEVHRLAREMAGVGDIGPGQGIP